MPTLSLTVDVDAPVDQTWAAVTDWSNQHRWMLGTRVEATHNNGIGVGGGLRATTGLGPAAFVDTMVITRWEPPYRCDVLHTGKIVRGTASFVVAPAAAGRSTFIWTEDLELPLGAVGRAGWVVIKPVSAAGIRYSLRRFADYAATRT